MVANAGIIEAQLILNTSQFQKSLQGATTMAQTAGNNAAKGFSTLQKQVDATTQSTKKATQGMSQLKTVQDNVARSFGNYSNQVQKASAATNGLVKSSSQLAKMVGEAAASTSSMGNSLGGIPPKATAATGAFSKITSGLKTMGSAWVGVIDSMVSFNVWMGAIVGYAFGKFTIGAAMQVDAAKNIFKYVGMSADEVNRLTTSISDYAEKSAWVSQPELIDAWKVVRMSHKMTADQMSTYNSVMGDTIALYESSGRTSHDAALAIEDGMGGSVRRLTMELGIQKQELLDNGWSGAEDDVDGFFKALDKIYEKRGIKGIAQDTSSLAAKWQNLSEKFQLAGVALGETLMPAIEKLVGWITWIVDNLGPTGTGIVMGLTAMMVLLGLMWPVISNIGKVFKGIGESIWRGLKGLKNWLLPSTKKVKIDCDQDDDCKVTCGDGSSGGIFGKSGRTNKSIFAGQTFLSGLSLIPALSGTTTATAAGMSLSGLAGTAVGTALLSLGVGGALNYADTTQSGNSAYNTIRSIQLLGPGALLRPSQASAGFVSDLWSGKGLGESYSNFAQNMNPLSGINDLWTNYAKVKDRIENNPIKPLADTKATLEKLGKGPQEAWEKAKKLVTGNPIKGKADADTKGFTKIGPMWHSARSVVKNNPIFGKLGITGNPAGTVAALIGAAQRVADLNPIIVKLFTRKSSSFNPFANRQGPAGPGDFLSQASGGFRYSSYGGSRQSIVDTISCMTGNCVDGTLAQMALAESFGIPSEMVMTTWKGNPHVFARIAGRDRDIANHALTGSWSAPPRGPGRGNGGDIIIQGDVYGFDDFQRKVEMANNRIIRGY